MRVGIDLGTTFSVAAYCDESGAPHVVTNRDGENTTPSVVMFDGGEIIVGQQAKDNADLEPANVCQFVKRWMGNKDYTFETEQGEQYSAEEISARILKRICDDCESALNEKITEAVITVPAYFSDAQRQSTIDAGRIAGLNVLAVINEPTAAALAYGVDKNQNQKVMIYDLGGGTFDVTIIQIADGKINVLATHGNRNLGGFDFDNKLITYVSEQFKNETNIDIEEDEDAFQALRTNCEKAKIALSSRDKYRLSVSAQHSKPVKIEVTRDQFEQMIQPIILETEISVDIALEDSGLSARDIDKVLLVGGSTRIPAVRSFIEKKMNMKPSCELNPDEAVAIGAAIYANDFSQTPTASASAPAGKGPGTGAAPGSTYAAPAAPSIIQDVNSHGLGIVADNEFGIAVNNIIIPRNQPIPAAAANDFATLVDNQQVVALQVTEGDDEDLSYVTIIGTAEIQLRPHPKGSPVRVELGYDSNGIVTGRLYDLVDNIYCGEIVIKREANMSEEELQSKAMKIKGEDLQ